MGDREEERWGSLVVCPGNRLPAPDMKRTGSPEPEYSINVTVIPAKAGMTDRLLLPYLPPPKKKPASIPEEIEAGLLRYDTVCRLLLHKQLAHRIPNPHQIDSGRKIADVQHGFAAHRGLQNKPSQRIAQFHLDNSGGSR
jgi:hypothetical protein